MRKQKMVRTGMYNNKDIEELLDDGWVVDLSNTWTGDHGETKYIEYILSKDSDLEIEGDVDKYIL